METANTPRPDKGPDKNNVIVERIGSASDLIDTSFKEEAKIQQTYSKHLTDRLKVAIPNAASS